MATSNIRLSSLFRDPAIINSFRRGELDTGDTYAVPEAPKPKLPSGALFDLVSA